MEAKGFVIDGTTFRRYEGPQVEILEIPEGVTAVASGAFDASCESMRKCKKIIFPASLKKVGDHLIRYNFNHWFDALEELIFKGDVETIGEGAFRYIDSYDDKSLGKIGIKSIIFEGHVGTIEDGAFPRSRIASVLAPKGIDKLGNWVFNGCMYLESVVIPGLQSVGEECFLDCKKLTNLEIPSSCKVSKGSFTGCEGLANADGQFVFSGTLFNTRNNRGWDSKDKRKWKSIPDGVTVIDDYAIGSNDSFTLPSSATTIKEQGYLYSTKIGYAENYFKTDKKLSGKGFLTLLDEQWAKKLSPEDWAYLYLFQTGKTLENILAKNKKDVNAIVQGMLVALDAFGKEKHFVSAAEYVLDNVDGILPENIQKMHDLFKAKKSKKATSLLAPYLGGETANDENDPYIEWRAVFNEHLLDKSIKTNRGDSKLFDKVKLSNTTELAPAYIAKCAIVPYLDQYTGRPKHIGGYKTDYIEVKLVELADKAASLLDMNDLQELLEQQYKNGGSAWLLPYGRFASGAQVTSLISSMRKWEDWYAYGSSGRSDIITARGALMLSDTREAMMNLDKKGLLSSYAAIRGTDADSIRDTVLAEFGLDSEGKKVYDLGTKRIIVSLTPELTLSLFDELAQKEIKSIPKKGTDPELAEKAAADFAEMKKNAKKVVKGRNDVLFEEFLSGKTRAATSWIASYTKNPLLRQVAKLIVWVQGKATFTLTETGAIDCNGTEYVIDNDTKIGVAHPIEMKKTEVEAWQKYFTAHGLKQPFSQIWEPAVDKTSIAEDRYKGCLIPFYRFRGQAKHGISVEDYDFHNEIYIGFNDCNATVERIDWRRHEINNEDNFEVTSFQFKKYTRRVNHIVAYLDNVTVIGRILKDDVSVATFLPQFTLAQITEFIKLASENNCTNVTAILLDHQQKSFPDFDPMAEFTLDL